MLTKTKYWKLVKFKRAKFDGFNAFYYVKNEKIYDMKRFMLFLMASENSYKKMLKYRSNLLF